MAKHRRGHQRGDTGGIGCRERTIFQLPARLEVLERLAGKSLDLLFTRRIIGLDGER